MLSLIKHVFEKAIIYQWYSRLTWLRVMMPLTWLYTFVIKKRLGQQTDGGYGVPVWTIGNITVGGNGKSPMVAWLIKLMRDRGIQHAVMMRGYGGTSKKVHRVTASDSALIVGDEAWDLFCQYPDIHLIVSKDRKAAMDYFEEHGQHLSVIISDDGLQNIAIPNDIVWVCVDQEKGLGNRYCLPVGPMRQPKEALPDHAKVIYKYGPDDGYSFSLQPIHCRRLSDGLCQPLTYFKDQTIHALAGIAFPDQFFNLLRSHGLSIVCHGKGDHADLSQQAFDETFQWMVTTKDAVKLGHVANQSNIWVLETLLKPSVKLLQLAETTLQTFL